MTFPLIDYTANNVEIKIGLRVFTNDLRLGTVVRLNNDGWHDVLEDGSNFPRSFNGERMTTVNPFTHERAV